MRLFSGTFAKYDPINAPKAPEINGVVAGKTHRTGFDYDVYVGNGNNLFNSYCTDQNPVPGFISTYPGEEAAYLKCGDLYNDTKTANYLLAHPDLKYINTNTVDMLNIAGTLKQNNGVFPFLYGRILFNGRYYSGKVHAGNGAFIMRFNTADGEKNATTNFDVLTCTPPTTEIETTTPNFAPCGNFKIILN